MFQSLSEIIQKWRELHEQFSIADYYLPENGYEREQIQALEGEFGVSFPQNFVSILERLNLDSVTFASICFGCGMEYLRWLRSMNLVDDEPPPSEYIVVAVVIDQPLDIELHIPSGQLYVHDIESKPPQPRRYITPNLETFIRLAATMDGKRNIWKTRIEARSGIKQLLEENMIESDLEFWATVVFA